MGEPTSCCRSDGSYCDRCDLLLGLDGLRVVAVDRDDGGALTVTVESAPMVMGCRTCGVVARGHGRLEVRLIDAPAMGRPVRICWRKRRWICPEPTCPVTTFVEQDDRVAAPRAKLTTRACRWAIAQLRREHASVNGLRRQLGTGWRTVWESIRPLLSEADADPARFAGVTMLKAALDATGVPSKDATGGHIGSLSRLEQFFVTKSTADPDEIKDVLRPLRDVRKQRQRPAHGTSEPLTDRNVYGKQRQVLIDVALTLQTLRRFLSRHPSVRRDGWTASDYLDEWLTL